MDFWENFQFAAANIPIVNNGLRVYDNYRYYRDYQRNTGFTPRYPYRVYNSSAANAAIGQTRSYGKMIENAFR